MFLYLPCFKIIFRFSACPYFSSGFLLLSLQPHLALDESTHLAKLIVSLPRTLCTCIHVCPPIASAIPEFSCSASTPRQSLALTWCWLWHDFQRDLGQQLQIWNGLFPSCLHPSSDILLAAPYSQVIRSCYGFFFPQAQLLVLALCSATDRAFPWTLGLHHSWKTYFSQRSSEHGAFQRLILEVPLACREGHRGKDHRLTKSGLGQCQVCNAGHSGFVS